ncbi:BppU family phage baseplate upper protein [Lactococcus lactis]|uniref:BppU family phage baseplate upper protein n=1 Tax=Lactococcus lactis TaxID=1358 RepID=UPI003A8105CA
MSDYSVTLSTTEPNNYVGLIKLRQGDVASQSIQATITANGQLFNFDHLAVFFNAVLPNGYVVRDKVTNVDYANSKLNYVVADSFLQEVAQVTAWFSFENDEKIIDSTKNFQYSVIGGWKECIPQGNYIYELSEIQREIEEIIGNKDFTSLISKISSLESNLKTRIDDLENETTAQLAQKVGNGKLASMADMGQDVKTAMTGGSVAVVGENTVIEKNVVDKQITPRKTSFLEQDSDNVLDPDFKKLYNCTYSNGIVESNVMSASQPFYII